MVDASFKAIVVGTSAGGFVALSTIFSKLRRNFPLPIIVVQHLDPSNQSILACLLAERTEMEVREAFDKELIQPGVIYTAPANYHLLVEVDYHFALSIDKFVCYSRPSIDVLFESASLAYGASLVGILLTGANTDGTEGFKTIKQNGGFTLAQDPSTAEAALMPRFAIQNTDVDIVLPLDEIGDFINKLCY
ncbi:MAG: chemotaxis protein CheB [Bdellovibrionota bacterium]